MLHKC